ncbi:MAG: SH3 domain-containing protein [Chloroflexi bacterium]|nr:SH3 domain-containing protein [Chloroflexota bacterium]
MRVSSVLCLFLLLVLAAPGFAQDQTAQPPLVVFIEEPRNLQMASVTDNGPDGLTRLADIFRSLGARTEWLRLRDPLPDDTKVVVLVRPRRPLSTEYLARMWRIVGNGGSLLVALDPQGYLGTNTEAPGRNLDKLLTLDEGVSLKNGILLEPWFTNKSFNELFSTFSLGFNDPVPNSISEPLSTYNLPVGLWGARSLQVEPFGINSDAWALVDARPEYVEAATNIYPTRNNPNGEPFELNLDKDQQGQVIVAAIGENTSTASRVAMIGDGEFLQNGYGLSLSVDNGTPRFPGNYILTQRMAAWLLRLPADQYPALPSGMTWIALDGSISDWPENAPVTSDDPADASILSLNLQQVRAISNDSYLYMSVETVAQANPDAQIDLEFDTTGGGQPDTFVSMRPGHVFAQSGDQPAALIPDADMGIGDVIELRLPLRITGLTPRIVSLCLSSARELAFPQPPDCMESRITVGRINQVDPVPLHYSDDPIIAVQGDGQNRTNVRIAPLTTAKVLTTVPYGTPFAAIGRTANGQWIQVQDAAYVGWVAREVLFTPSNLDMLPITS